MWFLFFLELLPVKTPAVATEHFYIKFLQHEEQSRDGVPVTPSHITLPSPPYRAPVFMFTWDQYFGWRNRTFLPGNNGLVI